MEKRKKKKLCEKTNDNRRYKLRRLMVEIAREYNAAGRYIIHGFGVRFMLRTCTAMSRWDYRYLGMLEINFLNIKKNVHDVG